MEKSSANEDEAKERYLEKEIKYKPPKIERKFIGESVSEPISVNSLHKSGWIEKRGHVVKSWKKRYIVLNPQELSYYEACEPNGTGKNLKGQVHFLGVRCELMGLKQKKKSSHPFLVEVTSQQEENKDLLLSFETLELAKDWYDALSWAIYHTNSRYIRLNLTASTRRSFTNNADPQHGPLHSDLERWYRQQSQFFEEHFQFLSRGCRFQILHPDSVSLTTCQIQGLRDSLSLSWCLMYPETSRSESSMKPESFKRSELRTIRLKDVKDVLTGRYTSSSPSAAPSSSSTSSEGIMSLSVLSIVSNSHTLELLYSQSENPRAVVWIKSLASVIQYLSLPNVPLIFSQRSKSQMISNSKPITAQLAEDQVNIILRN